MDCVFCKIIKGEIPCYKIYEDKKVLAFLDINPFSRGHTLLVPKKHSKWVWDLEEKDYLYLMKKVKEIAKAMQKEFKTDWIVEGIAGIEVPHAHIHIIPRKIDDGLGTFPQKVLEPKPPAEEMAEIAKRLREKLK